MVPACLSPKETDPMGLLRWFSVVAVALVLAGTTPAVAQGMPDEATRARVADWIDQCGRPSDACWPIIKRIEESAVGRWCRAIEAYWDTARLVRDPETVLHSIEELRGRREKAKEFLAECVPIFAAALDEAGGGDNGSSDAVYRGPVEPADRVMQAVKRSNLRRGPGTTHDKVGLLDIGDEVRVTGVVGDWLRIDAPDGGEAFIYGPLLAVAAPNRVTTTAAQEPEPSSTNVAATETVEDPDMPDAAALDKAGEGDNGSRDTADADTASALEPKCAGMPEGSQCWTELAGQPGCHVMVGYLRWGSTPMSWTGDCDGGVADGEGTLRTFAEPDLHFEAPATISAGRITYDRDSSGLIQGLVVVKDQPAASSQQPARQDSASADGDVSQTGPLHGSIAFSQDDDGAYAWGIAWSFDSSAGAEVEALGQCREYGGTRCAEAGWFQEACGALAIGDGNGYGTGWGATTGEAERDALGQCRVSNDDCRIEVARCAQSEQAGGAGQTDSEDTAVSREPADTSDDSCGRWEATSNPTWNEEGLRRGGLNIPMEHRGGTRAEAEDYAQRTCSGYSNHSEYSLLLVSCVVGEAMCVQPSGPQAEEDQPAATSPEQLCGVSEYLVEMEASNRAGCRFCFDRRLKTFRPENLHWSGSCSNGVVDGTGTLTSTDSLQIYETAAAFSAGVPHGHWVAAIIWKEGHQLLGEEEGAYVEGRREGDWAFRGALCSNGPYSNDESVHVEYYDCE